MGVVLSGCGLTYKCTNDGEPMNVRDLSSQQYGHFHVLLRAKVVHYHAVGTVAASVKI